MLHESISRAFSETFCLIACCQTCDAKFRWDHKHALYLTLYVISIYVFLMFPSLKFSRSVIYRDFFRQVNLMLECTSYYFKHLMKIIESLNLMREFGITKHVLPIFPPRAVQHPVVWSTIVMQLNFPQCFRALPIVSKNYLPCFKTSLNFLKLFKSLF